MTLTAANAPGEEHEPDAGQRDEDRRRFRNRLGGLADRLEGCALFRGPLEGAFMLGAGAANGKVEFKLLRLKLVSFFSSAYQPLPPFNVN